MSGTGYQHYSLRHRLTAAISQGLFRNTEYTVRHGLLKGMRRKGGLGFLPEWFPGASEETAEMRFWREYDLSEKVVWDVGAFEGLMTLFFATRAKRVIAYEPQPDTALHLRANVSLNALSNVTLRHVGIGDVPGICTLTVDPRMKGGGTIDATIGAQTSRVTPHTTTVDITVVTLDSEFADGGLPPPDLIKIDIEGLELRALRGGRSLLTEVSPDLFIELHGATLDDKRARTAGILTFLWSSGYTSIRHIESGESLTRLSANQICEGHLYCTAPASRGGG